MARKKKDTEAETASKAGAPADQTPPAMQQPEAQAGAGTEQTSPQVVPPPADPDMPDAVLEVVGPREGFRRANRRFGPDAAAIPLDELSEQDLAAIEAEPALVAIRRASPGES